MATAAKDFGRRPRPTLGRRRIAPPQSVISARVERMYIACVAVALGALGSAVGFAFGVVPYFREALDLSKHDMYFALSMTVGAAAGIIVGIANAHKWYRAAETTPLLQRRMLAYLYRRGLDDRGVPTRSVNTITLRSLMGTRGSQRA